MQHKLETPMNTEKEEIALNPNTSVETLTKLSADEGEGYQLLLKFLRL
jgi:hypothetical protein